MIFLPSEYLQWFSFNLFVVAHCIILRCCCFSRRYRWCRKETRQTRSSWSRIWWIWWIWCCLPRTTCSSICPICCSLCCSIRSIACTSCTIACTISSSHWYVSCRFLVFSAFQIIFNLNALIFFQFDILINWYHFWCILNAILIYHWIHFIFSSAHAPAAVVAHSTFAHHPISPLGYHAGSYGYPYGGKYSYFYENFHGDIFENSFWIFQIFSFKIRLTFSIFSFFLFYITSRLRRIPRIRSIWIRTFIISWLLWIINFALNPFKP